jgi:photosystem II stability/assembly factor-like uncharacterized protein
MWYNVSVRSWLGKKSHGWMGVFMFASVVSAQSWTETTLPAAVDFFGISFVNSDTGIVVGGNLNEGKMYRTQNGGDTWTDVTPYGTKLLYDVQSFSDQGFVAVGLDGKIWRSVDGGVNWSAVNSGTTQWLNGVTLRPNGVGLAGGTSGEILRSQDFGASWTKVASGTNNWILHFYFFSDTLGFASAVSGQVLRTTDGGLSWTPIVLPGNANVNAIGASHPDSLTAVMSNGLVLRSGNGGQQWFSTLLQPNGEPLRTLAFRGKWGITAGEKRIFITQNHGQSWELSFSTPQQEWLRSAFTPQGLIFLAGRNGKILRSNFLLQLPEEGQDATFLAYPNPASQEVHVPFLPESTGISVLDATGKLIFTSDLPMEGLNFSVAQWPAGMYWLCVHGSKTKVQPLAVAP